MGMFASSSRHLIHCYCFWLTCCSWFSWAGDCKLKIDNLWGHNQRHYYATVVRSRSLISGETWWLKATKTNKGNLWRNEKQIVNATHMWGFIFPIVMLVYIACSVGIRKPLPFSQCSYFKNEMLISQVVWNMMKSCMLYLCHSILLSNYMVLGVSTRKNCTSSFLCSLA